MKKFVWIAMVVVLIQACGKDEEPEMLATPSMDWSPTSVSGNTLEISITINSDEALPAGSLEFKVDGQRINTYQAAKGSSIYNTDYNFNDMESHTATLSYMFEDGRNTINKTISIKKSVQTVTQKSTKNDWVDF